MPTGAMAARMQPRLCHRRRVRRDLEGCVLLEARGLVGMIRSPCPRLGLCLVAVLVAAALPARQDETRQDETRRDETRREAAAAVDAALAIAASARSTGDLRDARGQLLAISQRFPRSRHPRSAVRARALVEAAALGRRTGDAAAAGGELLRVLEREAESEWTPRAHFELGELLLARGDWQQAANHLRLAREGWLRRAAAGEASVADLADAALERTTLIERMILRPLAGGEPWRRSRPYLPERVGIERPRGVAAGPDGELLVTEPNRAAILDAAGMPSAARDLRGIVKPGQTSRGPLAVITADGVTDFQAPTSLSFARPQGGALDRIVAAARDDFGNWTVLSRRAAEVLRYDSNGRLLETLKAAAMTRPIDLALGENGAIHVLDAGSRSQAPSVLRFAADGRLEESFRAEWKRPTAIDVDPLGNRYVLDTGALQVLVYDPAAAPVATIGPTLPGAQELRAPEDIAVDARGRIFIADSRLGTVLVVE